MFKYNIWDELKIPVSQLQHLTATRKEVLHDRKETNQQNKELLISKRLVFIRVYRS